MSLSQICFDIYSGALNEMKLVFMCRMIWPHPFLKPIILQFEYHKYLKQILSHAVRTLWLVKPYPGWLDPIAFNQWCIQELNEFPKAIS